MRTLNKASLILVIIGAINWLLIGLFKFDLVGAIFGGLVAWIFGGQTASVSRIIYAVVGLAGLWCINLLFKSTTEIKNS